LTKDREEDNYSSAIDAYKNVQQSIVKGTELELYGDVKRLLPDHARPQCIEMVMEIIPYQREERSRSGLSSRQVSSKSDGNKSKLARKRSRAEDDGEGSPAKRRKFIQSSSDDEEAVPKKPASAPKRSTSIPKSAPVGFQSARDLAIATEAVLASRSTSHKAKSPKFQNDTVSRKNPSLSKSRATAQFQPKSSIAKNDMAWLMDSDSDTVPKTTVGKKQTLEEIIDLTESEEEDPEPKKPRDIHVSPRRAASATVSPFKTSTKFLSTRAPHSPPESSPPVRRNDHRLPPKSPFEDISEDLSSPVLRRLKRKEDVEDRTRMPPPPLPRRTVAASESTVHPAVRKKAAIKSSILDRPEYLEVEAIHSGDEVEAGSSDPEDEENSSDREFVVDTSATQVSSDYDQSAVYRQGLFTQARAGGPLFASGPVRTGYLGRGRGLAVQGTRILPPSSPEKDEELDSYSLGSFVVDDDDDILAEASNEL
jgi:ATP-dependent DNA helicase MPH1